MKTVFILVDALKSTYLTEENMPFLYSLAKENFYVKEIIPCVGFCERSEIFTGLDGYDTGNFTAIGYSKENSPYKSDKLVLKLATLISSIHSGITKKIFQKWRKRVGRRLNCYRIPYTSLSNFSLTEDGNVKYTNYSTIFDVLKRKGLTYTLHAFTALSDLKPRNTKKLVDFFEDEIAKDTYFVPLYIGTIDTVGHKYGADIESIKPYLYEVDCELKRIYEIANCNGYFFSVLGDHGMVPVTDKINIIKEIEKCNLTIGIDYEAFYDSTIARFWFYNGKAKKLITQTLSERFSKYGLLIEAGEAVKHRIPMDIVNKDGSPVYGNLVWCANPGVLISPDYFHSTEASENGMHGYLSVVRGDGTGLYISNNKRGILEEMLSSNICHELCESLAIDVPNNETWKRTII